MATIATIDADDVIASSRTDINTNFANLNSDKIETSYLDTDTTLSANSDTKIATQKAVKAYADSVSSPVGKSWNEYAVDAVGTDSYAITISGVSAYVAGQTFKFKAGTANTGACSLNVNGIGPITIKKNVSSDLSTGDILQNQVIVVVYDGTYMQLVSSSPTDLTSLTTAKQYTVGALDNALVKTYFNMQLPFILWVGSTSGALTTDFPMWVRGSTDVYITTGGASADFINTGSDYLVLTETITISSGTKITYNNTNKIILDWWALLPATGTGDISMGFSDNSTDGFIQVYNFNDGTNKANRILFTQRGSTGVLYATIGKKSVGVTNTDISTGIDLSKWHNYRIEADLGTDAKFYIDGVLKATLSGANFPTAVDIGTGFGRSDTSLFTVLAPTLSVEMNP